MDNCYEMQFYSMVSDLAENFSRKDCQKLCFILQKQIPKSFSEKYDTDSLKLLEYLMQEKGLFSHDKPDKLAILMESLNFPEKKTIVDDFIANHRAAISVQHRALPKPPMPTFSSIHSSSVGSTIHGDDPYVHFQPPSNYDFSLPRDIPTLICQPSSTVNSEEETDVSYTAFKPTFMRSKSNSDHSSFSDDNIYAEPYSGILQSTAHEYYPNLLEERMKLLVKPMRAFVQGTSPQTLRTEIISCHLPKSSFVLEIASEGTYISAYLYLQPGFQAAKPPPTYYYLAELRVKQRCKKPQSMYTHSTLLDWPDHTLSSSRTPSKRSAMYAQDYIYANLSSSSIQGTDRTTHTGTDSKATAVEQVVATFPSILSHRKLMDDTLVTKPYLALILTIQLYRHEQ